jgi:hypothetical protein
MEKAVRTGRNGLIPIHAPGHDGPYRRFLGLHHPDLNIRRMRPQQYVLTPLLAVLLFDKKGVLHLAGWMVLGEIKG